MASTYVRKEAKNSNAEASKLLSVMINLSYTTSLAQG